MTTFSFSSRRFLGKNVGIDVRLPIIDCPCNAGLEAATHTTCHFIRLEDMQIYSGTDVSNIIKDNNEFWHLINSDRAHLSQISWLIF